MKELLGYSYLFTGKTGEGKELLKDVSETLLDDQITKEKVIEDYLSGLVDEEGIKAVYMFVDEKRESILKKQKPPEANWVWKQYQALNVKCGKVQWSSNFGHLDRLFCCKLIFVSNRR